MIEGSTVATSEVRTTRKATLNFRCLYMHRSLYVYINYILLYLFLTSKSSKFPTTMMAMTQSDQATPCLKRTPVKSNSDQNTQEILKEKKRSTYQNMCTWQLFKFPESGSSLKIQQPEIGVSSPHRLHLHGLHRTLPTPDLKWVISVASESFTILNLGFSHCSTTYLDITRN